MIRTNSWTYAVRKAINYGILVERKQRVYRCHFCKNIVHWTFSDADREKHP